MICKLNINIALKIKNSYQKTNSLYNSRLIYYRDKTNSSPDKLNNTKINLYYLIKYRVKINNTNIKF